LSVRSSNLRELLKVLIADLILLLHLRQQPIAVLSSCNLPPLAIDLNSEIKSAIMLEVALLAAAKRTEETRGVSHTIRVSLIMLLSIKRILIKILEKSPIFCIVDVMLTLTIITIASAGEITIFNC
jgi:hypothetical protein